ncbi:uncharacterized protein LOC122255722, partial [Penaeus japonicus]|uniref:uncharacterized protein LOC122255722 n=1 Tax=Penaeus japonicus TaxID=27405 RepID=UPI001C70BA42
HPVAQPLQNYNTDDRCQYEISCNPEESTYLEFICPSFELQSSTDCVNDRLVVTYHGSREEKCGTDSPDGTITSDGWTRLTFFSNADTTAPGFRCYIWCRGEPHHHHLAKTSTTTSTKTTTTTATKTTTTIPVAATLQLRRLQLFPPLIKHECKITLLCCKPHTMIWLSIYIDLWRVDLGHR